MNVIVQLLHAFSPSAEGSFFFWLLGLIGLLSAVFFVERLISVNFKSSIDASKFSADVFKMIEGGDVKKAYRMSESMSEKALAYIFARALKEAQDRDIVDYRNIQNAVDEAALEIIPRLTKRTSWLQTFANVSTLIGLTGTIFGLIQSFAALQNAGAEASTGLAAGISTAMLTTLGGLLVAIPSMLAYSFINNKTNAILAEIDEYSVKLIHLVTRSK
jgi:biopolymer transport protein ExbB